jgi:hypothetical protein
MIIKNVNMKKNMGSVDRIIRLIIASIIVALVFTNVIVGSIGVVLVVLAGIFTLTSFISFCPLYTLFGFSSCPVKK